MTGAGDPTPIPLPTPPELPEADSASMAMLLMPLIGGAGSIVMVVTMRPGPLGILTGALFFLALLAMAGMWWARAAAGRRKEIWRSRYLFFTELEHARTLATKVAAEQIAAAHTHFPDPARWIPAGLTPTELAARRLTPDNARFALVRYGEGPAALAATFIQAEHSEAPAISPDPIGISATDAFLRTHATLADLPALIRLTDFPRIYLIGPPAHTRACARALILSAALTHSPRQLRMALITADPGPWQWLKYLPHICPGGTIGPDQLVFTPASNGFATLFSPHDGATASPSDPSHWLIICDTGSIPAISTPIDTSPIQLWLIITSSAPVPTDSAIPYISIDLRTLSSPVVTIGEQVIDTQKVDLLSISEASAGARQIAAVSSRSATSTNASASAANAPSTFPTDAHALRAQRTRASELAIPLGLDQSGAPLILDLKEFAHGGMGPHGLIIGATGSGKSELLRTLVAGLILRHSAAELNLVLIDFKGGATFTPFAAVPHLSALITNLADDVTLVDRLADAIAGEISRRQELLRTSGPFPSQIAYESARQSARPELPPLPSLIIIVDEFSELLNERPDFADIFASLGRVGRSLGIHLLLASQRLDEGKIRGLESHISYRIAMRTFTELESRTVLNSRAAYHLPTEPGHGYLYTGSSLRRFRATYISGPHHPAATGAQSSPTVIPHILHTYDAAPSTPVPAPAPEKSTTQSILNVALARLPTDNQRAHQIWLPPLETPETLGQLFTKSATAMWLTTGDSSGQPPDHIPVGVSDIPRQQRRDITRIDLGPLSSHILVVGGPRSGKSTFALTCALAIAAVYPPRSARLFVLDGTGALAPLAQLSHCIGYARAADSPIIDAIFHHLDNAIALREQSADPNAPHPLIAVLIDGWSSLIRDLPQCEERLTTIAARGLSCAIRIIISTSRALDIRSQLRDVCGQVIEFKLTDPLDSLHNHKLARAVPAHIPGRGLNASGQHFHAAIPALTCGSDPKTTIHDHLKRAIASVNQHYHGPPLTKITPLPTSITLAELRARAPESPSTPTPIMLGLNQATHHPLPFDDHSHPLMVIIGGAKVGKTTFLRSLLTQLAERYSPQEAQFYLIDYRRTLSGILSPDHLDAHARMGDEVRQILPAILEVLHARLSAIASHPSTSPTRAFLIIDDYQLAREDIAAVLTQLSALLPLAEEIGLRLIISAKLGGLTTASDRLITHMWEVGAASILFSTGSQRTLLPEPLRAMNLPPGRAQFYTHDDAGIIQTPLLSSTPKPATS